MVFFVWSWTLFKKKYWVEYWRKITVSTLIMSGFILAIGVWTTVENKIAGPFVIFVIVAWFLSFVYDRKKDKEIDLHNQLAMKEYSCAKCSHRVTLSDEKCSKCHSLLPSVGIKRRSL